MRGERPDEAPREDPPDRGGAALMLVVLGCGVVMCAGSIGAAGFFAWKAARNAAERAQEAAETAVRQQAEAVDRAAAQERIGTLGRAIAQTLDENGPPTDTFTADGKPLLSWRVHLLPHIGQAELYRKFKLNEPWDSPANRPLIERMPEVYAPDRRTADLPAGHTYVRAFSHPGAVLEPGARVTRKDLTASASGTLVLFDAGDTVAWTRPDALTWPPGQPPPGFGGSFPGLTTFLATDADGRAVWVKRATPDATLRQLFDRRRDHRTVQSISDYSE